MPEYVLNLVLNIIIMKKCTSATGGGEEEAERVKK